MTDAIGIARLQDSMLEAFHHITSKEAEELLRATASSAVEKGFTYMRHGGLVEAINLMLVPSFVTVAQAEYLTKISLAVKRGVEAVYNAWFTDQDVRSLLPFVTCSGSPSSATQRPSAGRPTPSPLSRTPPLRKG